jgi:hypothetical protein
MNNQTTDFGDILASMITRKKDIEAEAARIKNETKAADLAAWREAMRPLLTVMRQVKERYPRASIHNADSEWSKDPHFYVEGNTRICVEYDTKTKLFALVRRTSGYMNQSVTELARSENPEGLIPPLLERLIVCIEKS